MVLDWLAKSKASGLPELLAKKQFAKAVELAQAQLKGRPRDGRLRLQLADTLIAAGRGREAVPLLREMADELAAEGFAAKAIAILKRIQKIDPGRLDVEKRLASVIAERARVDAAQAPSVPTPAPFRGGFEIGMEEIGFESPEESPEELPAEAEVVSPEPDPLGDFEPVVEADAAIDLDAPEPEIEAAAGPPPPALFPGFSAEELMAVMDGLRLVTFGPGELVVAEGEPGDSLFLVTSGSVKAWIRNREGRYVLVRRLGEGDFFGEISVLTGSPRTATVVAASACELLELDRPTLDGITAAHPRVREVLQQFYEQRIATSADGPSAPVSG
ncbi:MAG TPA: cyclic nucleotide-binding domain-containing protein [Vicinamibacteria bacterium]|nr:cyclic nucleotide-binding domain-containing protein [Vicinamibacteria bacterium]